MYFIDYKHFFYFSSFKSLETPIQNVDIDYSFKWKNTFKIPQTILKGDLPKAK